MARFSDKQHSADPLDLLFFQVGMHRQREYSGAEIFGNRKIASLITKRRVGFLEMKRNFVIDH